MKNLTLFIFLVTIFSGCTSLVTQKTGENEILNHSLRVGISTSSPPIAYREGGKITGLEVSFARGLARFCGKKLKLVQLPWEDQIPSLLQGKIDIIMSGMTVTELRRYRIRFSTPYMVSGQVALIRRIDRNRFGGTISDLLNPQVRLGTVDGTTGDLFIQDVKANGARTVFPVSAEAVKALLENKIDAFIYDLPQNLYLASKYADKGLIPTNILLTKEFLAWGIRPDNENLLENANNYLKSLTRTGNLVPLIQQWVPYYQP
ncbi:transporter substrate-binding domain-containing protein [Desulfomarina sp.]